MTLPLYDYDFNRIAPLLPQLQPSISIWTSQGEMIVDNQPGRMGIRQGSFRANPFNCQFTSDSMQFLIGTYVYRVRIDLPNGESRLLDDFRFKIF